MILNNTLIIKGNYSDISNLYNELYLLMERKKAKTSALYHKKTFKKIKQLSVDTIKYLHQEPYIKVSFQYKGLMVQSFIEQLKSFPVQIIAYSENQKQGIWIVDPKEACDDYHFIPEWVIEKALIDYMEYKASALVLDSFQTIALDHNTKHLVIDNVPPQPGALMEIYFQQRMNGKPLVDLLETFVASIHNQCINRYENLYVSSKEKSESEEPTPLALFIVTFGILAIILVFLVMMDYI